MYLPQILLSLVALSAILLWFLGGVQRIRVEEDRPSLPAIVLAGWIVSAAFFGSQFYVVQPAGLFDLNIERLFFVAILFLIAAGLFNGQVRLLSGISIEIVMGAFALVCIVSMVRSGFSAISPVFLSPWFIFISGYLFPFILFVFAKNYMTRERDLRLLLHTLFYVGFFLSVTAFFEFADLRQFVFPRYINDFEIGIHIDRARGPLLNAAFNGVLILSGLIAGLHLLQTKTGPAKAFYQTALVLFFPAVFFTLTRSVYVALLVTLAIFLGWYKTPFSKWKLISLPLAVILIVAVVNSPRLMSTERREGGVAQMEEVEIRIALLKRSFFIFNENPLAGIGLAQFSAASSRAYRGPVSYIEEEGGTTIQHNHLLGIATELGILGFSLYLLLIGLILRRLKLLAGKLPDDGFIGNNLRVVIYAFWAVYLTNNLFLEPSSSLLTNAIPFIFAGIADGFYMRSQESGLRHSSTVKAPHTPMRIMNSHV